MYKNFLKRLIDFLAAFFGLLVLSPIFLIVMIGLAIANGGKPFFFQRRPGKKEKIFKIIKFKTMNDKKTTEYLINLINYKHSFNISIFY